MFEDCFKMNRKRYRWRKLDQRITDYGRWMLQLLITITLLLFCHPTQVSAFDLTFNISENLPPGAEVGTVGDGRFIMFEQSEGVGDAFDTALLQNSGRVETIAELDREAIHQYTISLFQPPDSTYKITVDVLDINDNPPSFPQESITVEVSELTSIGHEFNIISAVDTDAPPFNVQGYRLATSDDYFGVNTTTLQDGTTRRALLVVLKQLDRETSPYHTLVVEAYDGGDPTPKTGRITVNVSITDSNDNAPLFTEPTYHANVSESATPGSNVIAVKATDRDAGVNGDVTYSIDRRKSDPDRLFDINANTGTIFVNKKLDSETATEHRLTVIASDSGAQPQSGSTIVIVQVTDVNDNQPTIDVIFLGSGNGRVSEGAAIGDYIARISVSDPDVGDIEKFNVTMTGGDGKFGLRTENDVVYLIRIKEGLDREESSSYDITLKVTDFGSPPKSATASFTIEVEDINDNPPKFDNDVYEVQISEESYPGTYVIHLSASDLDLGINSEFEYSLETSDQSEWFNLSPESGLITTATYLDHEINPEPHLTVVATDFGTPRLSSSATIVVKIANANDSAPRFESSSYRKTIPEDIDVSECFLQIKASDPDFPDLPDQIVYSFAEGSIQQSEILLSSTNGSLCVAQELDREKNSSYIFRIKATDKSGQHAFVQVTIEISDVNDHRPEFHPVSFVANVAATTSVAGNPVTRVTATDADDTSADGTGYGVIEYEIVSGNEQRLFYLDVDSGEIAVAKPLAAYANTVVVLRIRATDGGDLSTEIDATVTISILNDTVESVGGPVFTQNVYTFHVAEDALFGKSVGQVIANASGNAEVTYYIRSDPPLSTWFTVNSASGEISVASSLDREIFPSVMLQVMALTGSPPIYGFADLIISLDDVNDNPPVFNIRPGEHGTFLDGSLDFIAIPYTLPTGTSVYALGASDRDKDQNALIGFSLLEDHGYFAVDVNSGIIFVDTQLPHQNRNYSLMVQAFDHGTPPKSTSAVIIVQALQPDNACPTFSQDSYSISVAEDMELAKRFGSVSASSSTSVSYRLLPSVDSYNFGVYPDGSLYLTFKLDRELKDQYQITLVAEGPQTASLLTPCVSMTTIDITVDDVNDNLPFFDPAATRFSIRENLPEGSVVGAVLAADHDIGKNSELRYSVPNENAFFEINSTTGLITTTQILDRESQSSHVFLVQAEDTSDSPLMSQVSVRVFVNDDNDNNPRFLYTSPVWAVLRQNQAPGIFVASLQAVDADIGQNSEIQYSIVSGPEDLFHIDRESGIVTTKKALNTVTRHVLMIKTEDNGVEALSTNIELEVYVAMDSENEAKFSDDSYVFFIGNKTEPGSLLGRFDTTSSPTRIARDVDTSSILLTNFYISEGNENDDFYITRSSGELYVTRKLSFEVQPQYKLLVTAENFDNTEETFVFEVQINVEDSNDYSPTFSAAFYSITVQENVPHNTKVWKFSATDNDIGVNGEITYSIVNLTSSNGGVTSSQKPFQINSTTGELFTNGIDIDREMIPEYFIVVQATDGSHVDSRTTTVSARITVQDVNDNQPRFVSHNNIQVLEDEPIGFPVMYVAAEDDDLGANSNVFYSINQQWSSYDKTSEEPFQLNPTTGLITLIKKLDFEVASTYYLNVSATDSAALNPLASHQLLVIEVIDVNDEAPEFSQSIYYAELPENEEAGTLVTRVTATDGDSGVNGKVTYELFDKTRAFRIDKDTGVISSTEQLDREVKELYKLMVYAHDGAFPSLYTWCAVEVSILDTNDNAPKFAIGSNTDFTLSGIPILAAIEIPEYQPGPFLVYTVLATDIDSTENGKIIYSIADGNTGESFVIDSQTGQLFISDRLDREQTSSYQLKLVATDNGTESQSSEAVLDIVVLDWNDNDPKFSKSAYTAEISEGLPSGQFVLTVHASDADEGLNGKVTYSIDPGTDPDSASRPEGLFTVDPQTGVITTTATLDREKKSLHRFVIQAVDSAPYGPRKSSVTVDIEVTDVNDNHPVFTNALSVKNVSGSASIGSDIAILSAQDKDYGDNGTVSYRISGGRTEPHGSWNRFQIDANGRITSTTALNGVHTYYLNVTASDNGNPSNTAEAVVVINVVPFNVPNFSSVQFQRSKYSVMLSESAARNTRVTQVQANLYEDGIVVDDDESANIVYNFALGNEDERFSISHDGIITVKDSSQLDYETLPEIHLIVSATATPADGDGPVYTYCTINISLIDENDNEPKFSQNRYVTEVWEGQDSGIYVLQVTASDVDSGANGEVRYYIDSGNKDEAFRIDDITGIVTTHLKLDREVEHEYKLILHAYDMGNPRRTGYCTLKVNVVDINDNGPSLNVPPPGSIFVSESIPIGNVVTKVTANDLDLGTKEIRLAADENYQNDYFTIDSQDGSIYLAKSLDYEEMQEAKLKVQVTDGLHLVEKEILLNIVDENDNAPVFDQQSYQETLNELSAVNTSVIQIHAEDADSNANGHITYSLIDILPKKPAFFIDSHTGTIFTNTSEAFNPQSSIYNLIVMAEDDGTPSLNCTVSVRIQIKDINNHAPVFSSDSYAASVSEAADHDTHVINVSATDADFSSDNRHIYYEITSGNVGDAFKINTYTAMNGDNTIGEIFVAGNLDRENISSFSLTVTAFDNGTPVRSSETTVTVTIDDVNDNQPVFNQTVYSASIAEDAKKEPVVMVFATDPDSSSSLIFKITAGNDDGAFELVECDPRSDGCALISALNLDYEDRFSYNLSVQVWDGRDTSTSRSSVVPVRIQVLDVNEHPPYFTTMLGFKKVSESVSANQTVFMLPGEDRDDGFYGKLFYSIINGNSTGKNCLPATEMFLIINETGALKSKHAFDYEKCQKYTFRVRAENSAEGESRLARSQQPMSFPIEIEVTSEDEFPPVFATADEMTRLTVPYSAEAGYIVGQVNATDADAGLDGRILYKLNDGKEFVIDEITGIITLSQKLESSNNRIIMVTATSGKQSAQTWIQIEVEGAPVIAPEAQILAIVFGVIAGIALVIVLLLCVKHRRNKKASSSAVERATGQRDSDENFYDPSSPYASNNGISVGNSRQANGKSNSKKNSPNQQIRHGSGHASLNGTIHQSVQNGYMHSADNGTRSKSNSGGKSSTTSNGKFENEAPGKLNGNATQHVVRRSLSSGRGSALDDDTDLDKEVDQINSSPEGGITTTHTPPKPKIRMKISGQGRQKNHFPDSGIQRDIECGSEISDGPINIKSPSVESIHVFRDEGAGEEPLRIQDIEEELEEKDTENGLKQSNILSGLISTQQMVGPIQKPELASHYKSPLGSESNASNKGSKHGGDSVGADSGCSRRGRLQNWAPEFQPLADVFSEIAKLKDRENAVRAGTHNTFVMKDLNVPKSMVVAPDNTDPPPLITSVAEQRSDLVAPVPLGYTSSRAPMRRNVGLNLSGLYPHSNPQYNRRGNLPQTYIPSIYPNATRPYTSTSHNSGPIRPQVAFNIPHANMGYRASSLNSSQQGLSVSSLPRTPISHESSFTSPAMSPNLTPSLSPLATRSPSVSTVGESGNHVDCDSDNEQPGRSLSKSDQNLSSSRRERMVHV